jgi:hypothetical protein
MTRPKPSLQFLLPFGVEFTKSNQYLRISSASLTGSFTGTTVSIEVPLSSPSGRASTLISMLSNVFNMTPAPIFEDTMLPSEQTGLVIPRFSPSNQDELHSGHPLRHPQESMRSTACCKSKSMKSKALHEIPAPPFPTAS